MPEAIAMRTSTIPFSMIWREYFLLGFRGTRLCKASLFPQVLVHISDHILAWDTSLCPLASMSFSQDAQCLDLFLVSCVDGIRLIIMVRNDSDVSLF